MEHTLAQRRAMVQCWFYHSPSHSLCMPYWPTANCCTCPCMHVCLDVAHGYTKWCDWPLCTYATSWRSLASLKVTHRSYSNCVSYMFDTLYHLCRSSCNIVTFACCKPWQGTCSCRCCSTWASPWNSSTTDVICQVTSWVRYGRMPLLHARQHRALQVLSTCMCYVWVCHHKCN